MIDKRKIITMTKLAKYDKNHKEKDKKIYEYFRHDYVFKKNMATRFFTLLGGLILISINWANKIFVENIDIFSLNYKQEVSKVIVFLILLLFIYTIISSFISNFEYTMCQRRIKNYMALLRQLEKYDKTKAETINEEVL